MRPNRSTAAFAAASASARLVTSSLATRRSSDAPSAFATAAGRRPLAITACPAARAALAKSTPIPRAAPVIIQTFLLGIVGFPFLVHREVYTAHSSFPGPDARDRPKSDR